MNIPPSYTKFKNIDSLHDGVIVGDYLFIETYNMIERILEIDKGEDCHLHKKSDTL